MDGLRTLNKDLLSRNAELVQRLTRMKTERDNFEQLFKEWKQINHNSSEALNLLQKEKNKYYEENVLLNDQIKIYEQQIESLKMQNTERMEQCNHLLLRCSQYQNDINNLKNNNKEQSNDNNNINKLKFNYQQKKNEMNQILYQIQKLFVFCNENYPQITNDSLYDKLLLNGIEEEIVDNNIKNNNYRKRRSLNFIYNKKGIEENNNNNNKNMMTKTKTKTSKQRRTNKTKNNIDSKISAQLLGPNKQHNTDPFGRTQSSHSFFNEQSYRYNQVQINMNKMSTKLWSKRDSLSRKKKAVRINAIPSSANGTPLTTPHQSHRGKLDDDIDDIHNDHDHDHDDNVFADDPHHKYLQMMGAKDGTNTQQQQLQAVAVAANNNQKRTKLTDKKTIHDLFDMLQQQQLSPSSPISTTTNINNDVRNLFDEQQQQQTHDNTDAQLVPLCDSSTDSDSDSSSD